MDIAAANLEWLIAANLKWALPHQFKMGFAASPIRFFARSAFPKVTSCTYSTHRHFTDRPLILNSDVLKTCCIFSRTKAANWTGDPAHVLIFSRHSADMHVNPSWFYFIDSVIFGVSWQFAHFLNQLKSLYANIFSCIFLSNAAKSRDIFGQIN
jgi:hypothetical protein